MQHLHPCVSLRKTIRLIDSLLERSQVDQFSHNVGSLKWHYLRQATDDLCSLLKSSRAPMQNRQWHLDNHHDIARMSGTTSQRDNCSYCCCDSGSLFWDKGFGIGILPMNWEQLQISSTSFYLQKMKQYKILRCKLWVIFSSECTDEGFTLVDGQRHTKHYAKLLSPYLNAVGAMKPDVAQVSISTP